MTDTDEDEPTPIGRYRYMTAAERDKHLYGELARVWCPDCIRRVLEIMDRYHP
jgi:hypothetical protein